MRSAALFCAVVIVASVAQSRSLAGPPLAEKYLIAGNLAEGETALLERVRQHPRDDEARFGLGALQFLRSVERLGQSLHRYGLHGDSGRFNIPLLRLPIQYNRNPEEFTYPASRKILAELVADLAKAEATLAEIRDDDVKLALHVGEIRLDLVGNGKATEGLSTIIERIVGRGRFTNRDLLVVFDRGDVAWLRGYCHLLSAMAEVGLAYDGQELFDVAAPLLFARAKTPHEFMNTLKPEIDGSFFNPSGERVNLTDVIALIHLIRMPVKEPERMKAALAHLEKTIALGRESWKHILAETDDDHEWIPNPRQTGVLGFRVRQEQVDSWLSFLDESEELLKGRKLIPFWRGTEKRGVNLRRVFTEPRAFDLVLWVQGSAATPYLEEGPMTNPAVWGRLQRVFGGDLFGFAVWFN
jgi:hypothetical protein